jgi:hypothetical protein
MESSFHGLALICDNVLFVSNGKKLREIFVSSMETGEQVSICSVDNSKKMIWEGLDFLSLEDKVLEQKMNGGPINLQSSFIFCSYYSLLSMNCFLLLVGVVNV